MTTVALIWLSFVTKVVGWLVLSFGHAYSTWWSCGLGCVWACGAYKDNSSSSPPYSRWIIYDSFWLIPRVSVYHPLLGVMRSSIWADNKWSSDIWKCFSLLSSTYDAVLSLSPSLFINLKYSMLWIVLKGKCIHSALTAWNMGMWCHLVK